MKKLIKYSVIIFFAILIGFATFIIVSDFIPLKPIIISKSWQHPEKPGYNIFNFKEFVIELPVGWLDRGCIVEAGGGNGELFMDEKVWYYGFGTGTFNKSEAKTLHKYLYDARNNLMIMGNEIIVGSTDSTISVSYMWPIDPESSDTLNTGLYSESLKRINPPPNKLYKNCNYYSLTQYNDSTYFIPIEVPEIVVNSITIDSSFHDYQYNIVRPKKTGTGITIVIVSREPYSSFSIWGYDLDFESQEELIKAGLSVTFDEIELTIKKEN